MPTLVLICNVKDPVTGEAYSRDPRYIATKAERYLKSTGIADTAYFGPEPEFFIFDDVRFDQSYNYGVLLPRRGRGVLEQRQRTRSRTSATRSRYKEGYFPVPPMDSHCRTSAPR